MDSHLANSKLRLFVIVIFWYIFASRTACANDNSIIQIYSSNNKASITIKEAYDRLCGQSQKSLEKILNQFIAKNSLIEAQLEPLLGLYKSSKTKTSYFENAMRLSLSYLPRVVSNNTEGHPNKSHCWGYKAILNPTLCRQYETINTYFLLQAVTEASNFLTVDEIDNLATDLAIRLNQESVLIFIPENKTVENQLIVTFNSYQPTIDELVTTIKEKIPFYYNLGFSLYLNKACKNNINQVTVRKIEWLGSKLQFSAIKNVFPYENIEIIKGVSYVVYQQGAKEHL